MALNLFDVKTEYSKNQDLKEDVVKDFMKWASEQPHLPIINEVQAIIFLHSCYYQPEAAKTTLDIFFTTKTTHSDLFKGRNPLESPIKESLDVTLFTPLPQKTPQNHTVTFLKLMDTDPAKLNYAVQLKIFDMICMLHLHQDGTSDGHCMLIDLKGAVFGHLLRAQPLNLKRFLYYVQEALPGRIKQIHFFNIVPFMDKILALVKPLMKKELLEILHLHTDVEDLVNFVPRDCLPQDYGGLAESTQKLHENIKNRVFENVAFFNWEDEQTVDESKRPAKSSNRSLFGKYFSGSKQKKT